MVRWGGRARGARVCVSARRASVVRTPGVDAPPASHPPPHPPPCVCVCVCVTVCVCVLHDVLHVVSPPFVPERCVCVATDPLLRNSAVALRKSHAAHAHAPRTRDRMRILSARGGAQHPALLVVLHSSSRCARSGSVSERDSAHAATCPDRNRSGGGAHAHAPTNSTADPYSPRRPLFTTLESVP